MAGFDPAHPMFQHIARLSRIRRHYRALTHGSFELVWVSDRSGDESDAGVLAFERRTPEGEYALVVINARSDKASRTSFEGAVMEVTARGTLRDVLGDASFGVGADGLLDVELGPNEAVILVPEAEHQAF